LYIQTIDINYPHVSENILIRQLTTGWSFFFDIESFFHAGADFNFSLKRACSSRIGLKI
jgi:hypothetical protein